MTTDALVGLDPAALRGAIGRRPLLLRHGLSGHPSLSRAALAAVAEVHPGNLVEHHRADLPLVLPTGEAERLPVSPRAVIEGIEENRCWMVLWHIDTAAPYDALVEQWVEPIRAAIPTSEGALGASESLALIASPGAVVPAHVDHNHNVLLQLEGTKELFIGEFSDASEGQRQVERRYGPAVLNLDRLPERVTRFVLGPGDALYIPPYAFHWVVGGPDVSVALSCSVTTAAANRAHEVHAWNGRLRRLGIHPRPPGEGLYRDRAKVRALHSWIRFRRLSSSAQRRLSAGVARARSRRGVRHQAAR
jgi:ribosomal protein L16 Arg81 hydroxylase